MPLSGEDIRFFADKSGLEYAIEAIETGDDIPGDRVHHDGSGNRVDSVADESLPNFDEMARVLALTYFNEGPTAFAELVEEHRAQIVIACAMDESLRRILLIGLQMGIDQGNGSCALELGALYYTGDVVEQDYAKAAELYEIAANAGIEQAIVNLGYIYEYGRTGKRDSARAYMYYSFAAVAFQNAEAMYKMGDMYSRGQGVQGNEKAAFTLWQRSFDATRNVEIKAQAALRLAQVIVDGDSSERIGVKYDPMLALELFQTAEIGLRISIANGFAYYEKRLQEALDGQERARQALDMPSFMGEMSR